MNEVVDTLGSEGFGTYEVDWSVTPPGIKRVDKQPSALVIPGFVDIHIHGAYGIDFMSASQSDMLDLCERLEEVGYEMFLPTTVTAAAADVATALSNIPDHGLIGGFHLEGPFISTEYPGAQPKEHICEAPDGPGEWDAILDDPRLKVVTIAPETPRALQLIAKLNSNGVIASMGHTNATHDEARAGFDHGAAHTTHTFNAMRPLHHREAGTVGYALLNDALRCELIYDRLHVSPEAAGLLFKSKPPGGVLAVSDSTMATGMPPGQKLNMWGMECVTGPKEVRLLSNGALAGSAITLLDAFRNLHDDFGPEIAIRACCLNPRSALRLSDPPSVYLELDKELGIVERRMMKP
ncbi:MAG: amidohydrolase family protein [Armatimonadetes bacterium]|nr:amidohydrolase family protein [Armatimonadota bacterium]